MLRFNEEHDSRGADWTLAYRGGLRTIKRQSLERCRHKSFPYALCVSLYRSDGIKRAGRFRSPKFFCCDWLSCGCAMPYRW